MNVVKKIGLLATSLFTISACSVVGLSKQQIPEHLKSSITSELKPNMSTSQVKQIMGKPLSSEFNKNKDCYVYKLYDEARPKVSGYSQWTKYQLLFIKDKLVKIDVNTACDSVIRNYKG